MQAKSPMGGTAAFYYILPPGDGASLLRQLEVGKDIVVKYQGALVLGRLMGCRATDSAGQIWRCSRSCLEGDDAQLDLNSSCVKVVQSRPSKSELFCADKILPNIIVRRVMH